MRDPVSQCPAVSGGGEDGVERRWGPTRSPPPTPLRSWTMRWNPGTGTLEWRVCFVSLLSPGLHTQLLRGPVGPPGGSAGGPRPAGIGEGCRRASSRDRDVWDQPLGGPLLFGGSRVRRGPRLLTADGRLAHAQNAPSSNSQGQEPVTLLLSRAHAAPPPPILGQLANAGQERQRLRWAQPSQGACFGNESL